MLGAVRAQLPFSPPLSVTPVSSLLCSGLLCVAFSWPGREVPGLLTVLLGKPKPASKILLLLCQVGRLIFPDHELNL